MSDYPWPLTIVPSACEWTLEANTASFNSRALVRPGDRWSCTLTMPVQSRADSVVLRAFIARLRGGANRALLPVWGWKRRGAAATDGAVDGAGQTGTTLNVDGVQGAVENAVRVGDFIAVGGRLYMVAEDADSGAGGTLALTLTHPIDSAPSDGAVVSILQPLGRFILTNALEWDNLPFGVSQMTPLRFIEDIP